MAETWSHANALAAKQAGTVHLGMFSSSLGVGGMEGRVCFPRWEIPKPKKGFGKEGDA